MTHLRRLIASTICGSLVLGVVAVSMPPKADAALQSTIVIEQVSPALLGTWTFFAADKSTKTSKDKGIDPKKTAFSFSSFGPVTLSIRPPAGMSSLVSTYRGGELLNTKPTTQINFNLLVNDSYRFVVRYSFSNVGTFGITSNPTGATLTLSGPDGFKASAKAPHTFSNLPAGKYTVIGSDVKGCTVSLQYNRNVEQDKRVTLNIDMPCSTAKSTDIVISDTRKSKREIQQEAELREALRAAKKGV